jgi:hypothetical protein
MKTKFTVKYFENKVTIGHPKRLQASWKIFFQYH